MVNIASMVGHLNKYTPSLRQSFLSASQTSVAACSELMEKFTTDVREGKEKERGWPSSAYAVSKAGEIAFTFAVAKEVQESGSDVLVNACCPGFVNTDMTKGRGRKNVDQGAQTPVMLALGDIGGKTGGFWQHESLIEW